MAAKAATYESRCVSLFIYHSNSFRNTSSSKNNKKDFCDTHSSLKAKRGIKEDQCPLAPKLVSEAEKSSLEDLHLVLASSFCSPSIIWSFKFVGNLDVQVSLVLVVRLTHQNPLNLLSLLNR